MLSLETSLFALALVVVSAVLLWRHKVAWQLALEEETDAAHREFLRVQCRRRLQASGLIGVIGLAMFVGQFLDRWPLVKVFHWTGVLLLVVWVLLLALADLMVSRLHFGRLRRNQMLAAVRYYAEFKRGEGELDKDEPSPDK